MSSTYAITTKTKILIYGAGLQGQTAYQNLTNHNFTVLGYIDKNAQTLQNKLSAPVYTIAQSVAAIKQDFEQAVVIICLHNALWHNENAKELYRNGYNNILFIPLGDEYRRNIKNDMEMKYAFFADLSYEKLTNIATYRVLVDKSFCVEDAILLQTPCMVTVRMEISGVFSSKEFEKTENPLARRYTNVGVTSLRPYIQMFKYCIDGTSDTAEYYHAFQKIQNTHDVGEAAFVADRVQLYAIFRQELDRGLDFFINSPANLIWDDNHHRFHAVDGHHRLIFLYLQGYRTVPVEISRADFEKWVNRECFDVCAKLFEKQKRKEWYTPLNHPAFFELPSKTENISPLTMEVLQEVCPCLFEDKKIAVDLSGLGGYYARAFCAMGYTNVSCFCYNPEEKSMVRAIDDLFYCGHIALQDDFEYFSALAPCDTLVISLVNLRKNGVHCSLADVMQWNAADIIVELDDITELNEVLSSYPAIVSRFIKKSVRVSGVTDIWLLRRF